MFVIRLIMILVLIGMFVLLMAYVTTRDKKYLRALLLAVKYLGWALVVMLVLFLITRVIRL